jgi:hypothetical protein
VAAVLRRYVNADGTGLVAPAVPDPAALAPLLTGTADRAEAARRNREFIDRYEAEMSRRRAALNGAPPPAAPLSDWTPRTPPPADADPFAAEAAAYLEAGRKAAEAGLPRLPPESADAPAQAAAASALAYARALALTASGHAA